MGRNQKPQQSVATSTIVTHLLVAGRHLTGRDVVVAELVRGQGARPGTNSVALVAGPDRIAWPPDCPPPERAVTGSPRGWLRLLRRLNYLGSDNGPVGGSENAAVVLHVHGLRLLLMVAALRATGVIGRWGGRSRPVIVYSNHGFVETTWWRRWALVGEPLLYRAVDAVVVPSRPQLEWLAPRSPRPVRLVPNAVAHTEPATPQQRAAARERFGVGDCGPVVGIVGRLAPEKRLDVFLAAVARIAAVEPGAVGLVAGDGPRAGAVRRAVDRLGLSESIQLTGHLDDVAPVLAALDLLLHTADTEGTPLAVIEAMAAGVPVVASAVGGLPALLGEGRYGVLVPPDRPDLFAAAALGVLADAPGRAERAKAARDYVTEEHGVGRMCTELDRVYALARAGGE
ncbi:MAG TPA: glycosyltransferase [Kineosporiaceae bacterium]|nr:glycosyltransferase [Kineosporiaceae bacterium]